jgi:hypothetical protein
MTVKTRLLDRLTAARAERGMMRSRLGAALLASFATACGGPGVPGSKSGTISPPPRTFLVQEDRVVIEGRWHPIEPGPKSPAILDAVRVVCVRAERSCTEDLTRFSTYPGAEPVHDVLQYRVDEWTKWGKPAGKLVASRRADAIEVQIRVSLSGLAAEKVVIDKEGATRWRLE